MVRNSKLGRRIGWLRKASPGTYAGLRAVYQRLVDRGGPSGLSPYQRRALEEFIDDTPQRLLAIGVLEVGSDLSGNVVSELVARGIRPVVGINPALSAVAEHVATTLPAGAQVFAVDLRSSGLPSEGFGAIFSVAVLEHLLDVDTCLAEMHRLLVPGGRVHASFGPIWSSSLGHHIYADVDGVRLRHWDPRLNPIADHAHLMQTPEEMFQRVATTHSGAVAEAAVHWVYEKDDINRLFFEDYVAAFERSPFRIIRLTTEKEAIPSRRLSALRAAHPDRTVFDVRNAVVVLEKVG